MNWRMVTVIVCLSVAVLLIGYDVLAGTQGGVGATISRVVRQYAMQYPLIPLLIGILLGHLFWSQGQ